MKEITDIITAYNNTLLTNKACALATVVQVIGSSYRRPGARMLVTDDGMLTGAISGGCLEGDALRKALLAISEGKNKLVTYDTTDEDDAKFGVQLGCNGIVHILFEPINPLAANNPIELLKKVVADRQPSVVATLFSLTNKTAQIGTCFFCNQTQSIAGNTSLANSVFESITKDAQQHLQLQKSLIQAYESDLYQSFFQYIPTAIQLIIVGAGNDALPLAQIAAMQGWATTVVDGRPTHANAQRFATANKILVAKAENVLPLLAIDKNTACVLMTHNYNYDLAVLKSLLQTNIEYLGILGPKTKMQRMYDDLEKDGIVVTDLQKENIYSPIGLDIGAETSEEIALSVAAEIKAVLMHKNAQMLREKTLPVHG